MTETDPGSASGATTATRGRGGPLARLLVFLRQVVGELKKVVYPTRDELVTYTTVVLVFVAVVMTYVSLLDLGFGRLVLWVLGGS
ncbi:preprotein translocase subunit SecE [Quadrisphaera sp. INWT6]|uniref:preprotein translocase subunit SecE n=1 Tax=Quadrisphaera sp. INWT6 TaxID=2596917 RepID=UPI0018920CD4|nr:preprotein translocase subunit SecE [Quadrisphaera sp. INWT6]MBF5081726.1 preprotein translocase subunit SecE [Quadrisphaera sp. INWT6]